jgi:hypothetical protein
MRSWWEASKFGIVWEYEWESVSDEQGPDSTNTKVCCGYGFFSSRQCLSATFEIGQSQNGCVVRVPSIPLQYL